METASDGRIRWWEEDCIETGIGTPECENMNTSGSSHSCERERYLHEYQGGEEGEGKFPRKHYRGTCPKTPAGEHDEHPPGDIGMYLTRSIKEIKDDMAKPHLLKAMREDRVEELSLNKEGIVGKACNKYHSRSCSQRRAQVHQNGGGDITGSIMKNEDGRKVSIAEDAYQGMPD